MAWGRRERELMAIAFHVNREFIPAIHRADVRRFHVSDANGQDNRSIAIASLGINRHDNRHDNEDICHAAAREHVAG